ncbi:LysR family transcriptional regulator [Pseudomonas aeruginosa]|uniref:LysR family transcriptional regulator n=1 Tax=Pseudomonas aeruginosa TaxID=287 RepID=UPI000FC3FDCE|nr:LysR family transcriptional regulator [Pseudomonas aeruginosa]RUI13565.1 LysR family transcriptional regulator [Pseudomonas aeruginosa]
MHPLDLQQLQSFACVVDIGSISAAAPVLCRSPSAISEQLQKLEAFLGVKLLVRSKKGVTLTPAGERLHAHAHDLLTRSSQAVDDTRGENLDGELRLAITDYFRPHEIPRMLAWLRSRYPRLRLHVSMRRSLQIEHGIKASRFDIGLSMQIIDGDRHPEGITVRREALQWVAAKEFEHDPKTPLPLLALTEGCALQHHVQQSLQKHGVPFVVAHSASGVAGLQAALSAGLGVACLNASAIPDGVVPWRARCDLPPVPDVEFRLLGPSSGESDLVRDMRQRLAEHLTRPIV